jgi:hypothetical protein
MKLDPQTNKQYVDMTLYLEDVKILYNACVDILNKHPEMIGYKRTADKLEMVIADHYTNQMEEENPYIECGKLEETLNRNQRDVLDYYMIKLNKNNEMGVHILLGVIKFILENYDGKIRMSDKEIENFWAVLN